MSSLHARARVREGKIMVALYGPNGYDGHASIDEVEAERLRGELAAAITELTTESEAA